MSIVNLSELNTKDMMVIIAKVAMPVKTILGDKTIRAEYDRLQKEAVKKSKGNKEAASQALGTAILMDIVPLVITNHMDNVAIIYGALTGKSIEEVYAQPAMTTFSELGQIIKNPEIMGFFQSLNK